MLPQHELKDEEHVAFLEAREPEHHNGVSHPKAATEVPLETKACVEEEAPKPEEVFDHKKAPSAEEHAPHAALNQHQAEAPATSGDHAVKSGSEHHPHSQPAKEEHKPSAGHPPSNGAAMEIEKEAPEHVAAKPHPPAALEKKQETQTRPLMSARRAKQVEQPEAPLITIEPRKRAPKKSKKVKAALKKAEEKKAKQEAKAKAKVVKKETKKKIAKKPVKKAAKKPAAKDAKKDKKSEAKKDQSKKDGSKKKDTKPQKEASKNTK